VYRHGLSTLGTTAPRGTSKCEADPLHEDCTSCGYQSLCDSQEPSCQRIKRDPQCRNSDPPGAVGDGFVGYYGAFDDELNLRAHRMKERFGVDPQFPIARYVQGFTSFKVPNRPAEHAETIGVGGRREIGDYADAKTCRNPIFAAALPRAIGDELCNVPRGPRSPELVVFGLLAGVPGPLVDGGEPNWPAIVGANPDAYDFAGQDAHMVPSIVARAGLPGPSAVLGDNGTDPVHGREWNTQKRDLQYACTFELPAPRQCDSNDPSCDCASDQGTNPPLCSTTGQQIRGKAYPSLRPAPRGSRPR
jgi:hypothetical protein